MASPRILSLRLSVAIMGTALLLPFFRMGGTGCAQSKPFPCESQHVQTAAEGLLADWVKERGKFYDLEVVPFRCPDFSDLNDDGRLVAPFSRRGTTACADFNYWQSRPEQKAGSTLHERLADEFESKEPVGSVDYIRMPGQPDAQLESQCSRDSNSGSFECELSAQLFLMLNPLDEEQDPVHGDNTEAGTQPTATGDLEDGKALRKADATKR